MKVFELFDASNETHLKMMQDLDHFTASPRMNLKPETIAFLQKNYPHNTPMKLYRVLFTDDLDNLAVKLGDNKIEGGSVVFHSATRVSSWSKSKAAVEEMAVENADLGGFAVILSATIPAKDIIIDLSDLSASDREHVYVMNEQHEVIVNAGRFECKILDITRQE